MARFWTFEKTASKISAACGQDCLIIIHFLFVVVVVFFVFVFLFPVSVILV